MHDPNAEQITYWNGIAGERWTQRQAMQDQILAPISRVVLDHANPAAGEFAIDVGCGCGTTTLDLAHRVGPAGHVLGLDVSAPMLTRARSHVQPGTRAEFVQADATTYGFAPAATDLLFSRFGVMFFAEPAVSFANMRTALKPDGRLTFVCWREPRLNPWLLTALKAAYAHVPRLPEQAPEAPGPFAFASEDHVRRLLNAAGYCGVAIEPVDFMLDLACGGGLDAAVTTALEIGPASRALDGQPDDLRAAAKMSIRETLATFEHGGKVDLAAAVWIVSARALG